MPRNLSITPADVAKLVEGSPLAAEQLKNIVLERLLDEAEAKLAAPNHSEPDRQPELVK